MTDTKTIVNKILGNVEKDSIVEKVLGSSEGIEFKRGGRQGPKRGPQDGTGPNEDCDKK